MPRTQLIISKTQCLSNIRSIQESLENDTKIMAVVKSNAYGCNVATMAPLIASAGIHYFGVATVSEAIELYNICSSVPILLLSEPLFDDLSMLPESCELTVYSELFIKKLRQQYPNRCFKLHLKLNTGLNRLGASEDIFWRIWSDINELEQFMCVGVCTHLVESEVSGSEKTKTQLTQFKTIVNRCKTECNHELIAHVSNSAGLAILPSIEMDMVRIGLGIYKNAIRLHAKVLHTHRIQLGETVSYGQEFTAVNDCNIAILSIGYSDGIPSSTQSLTVSINNGLYPVVGRICMDMICVNLGDDTCNVGDDVVIFNDLTSRQEHQNNLSSYANTTKQNPREALSKIGSRVERVLT